MRPQAPKTAALGALILAATVATGCGSSAANAEHTLANPNLAAHAREQNPSDARSGATTQRSSGPECRLQPVHFAFDSSDLDERARSAVSGNVRCITARHNQRASVVGMTDPRGTEEYNLALGDRRARTTVEYARALGAPAESLSPTSVGEEYATGGDEGGWAHDRRAEFEIR